MSDDFGSRLSRGNIAKMIGAILKRLDQIATSLDKIEKHLQGKQLQNTFDSAVKPVEGKQRFANKQGMKRG